MPIYEYECTECRQRTELLQRFGDPPLAGCPECGSAVRKLFSAPSVQFKGSGWYVTDYAGKGKPAAGSDGKKEPAGGKTEAAGDGGKEPSAAKSSSGAASDKKSAGTSD